MAIKNAVFTHRLCVSLAPLRWRQNGLDSVSNHQPHDCLLNRLFRRRSNKTSKLRVTGHCAGNSPGPVNSPHKGPVTRKMFPFDDVIMTVFVLLMVSQLSTFTQSISWHVNSGVNTWKLTSDSLDIVFIHGHYHSRSCKKYRLLPACTVMVKWVGLEVLIGFF